MNADWRRLAMAIRERRRALNMSQQQLADAARVTSGTVKNLEGQREFTRLPSSIPAMERALGWKPGSAELVLYGGEPTVVDHAPDRYYTRESFTPTIEIIRDVTHGIVAYVAPDTPFSKVREAERQTIALFRRHGLLPREEPEQDVDKL